MATEYGKMTWHQRGRVKNSDPKRYAKIKAQHEAWEDSFRERMSSLKTARARAELRLDYLKAVVEHPTSGVTQEEVAAQAAHVARMKDLLPEISG